MHKYPKWSKRDNHWLCKYLEYEAQVFRSVNADKGGYNINLYYDMGFALHIENIPTEQDAKERAEFWIREYISSGNKMGAE